MPKPEISYANGKMTAPDGEWYINGTDACKQKRMQKPPKFNPYKQNSIRRISKSMN
jgi:hypothetical protein